MTGAESRLRIHLVAVAAALACAVLAAGGLSVLTRPSHFQARLDAVARDAETAARLMRASRVAGLPVAAACSGQPADAATKLSAELGSLAAVHRLDHARIAATPLDAGLADAGLAPIQVQFEASGPYEAVIGALDHLAGLRPVLFIDTVDLTPKTSFVTLALSGRVYCSARH